MKDVVILNGKCLLPVLLFAEVKERFRLNELSVLFLANCCNDTEDPLLFLGNGEWDKCVLLDDLFRLLELLLELEVATKSSVKYLERCMLCN